MQFEKWFLCKPYRKCLWRRGSVSIKGAFRIIQVQCRNTNHPVYKNRIEEERQWITPVDRLRLRSFSYPTPFVKKTTIMTPPNSRVTICKKLISNTRQIDFSFHL